MSDDETPAEVRTVAHVAPHVEHAAAHVDVHRVGVVDRLVGPERDERICNDRRSVFCIPTLPVEEVPGIRIELERLAFVVARLCVCPLEGPFEVKDKLLQIGRARSVVRCLELRREAGGFAGRECHRVTGIEVKCSLARPADRQRAAVPVRRLEERSARGIGPLDLSQRERGRRQHWPSATLRRERRIVRSLQKSDHQNDQLLMR